MQLQAKLKSMGGGNKGAQFCWRELSRKQALLFSVVLLMMNGAYAQDHGVCDSALEIAYSNTANLNVHASGAPNPLLSMPHANGRYFEKPHAVAWFTFVAPADTILTFDITPANQSDDLDFLLFKDNNGNLCRSMRNGERPIPVRANIANTALTTGGKTGLSNSAASDFEALGRHADYSRSLKVKKGERFYLAVDDYTHAQGEFNLHINFRYPQAAAPLQPPPPLPVKPHFKPLRGVCLLKIMVADSAAKPVKARIKVILSATKSRARKIVDTAGTSEIRLEAAPREDIKISCIGEGYLLSETKIKIPDTATIFNDTILLTAIRKNGSITLQDIEFEPEQDVFMSAAAEPLSDLLAFMKNNKGVHILIKGYVNDPFTQNSDKYDVELSEKRAKAVMKYLQEHGIDKKRMDWKGFGNKDMLYPKPRTEEEARANRRVVIEVK